MREIKKKKKKKYADHACAVQGYLAHKKTPYPRTLHSAYAYGPVTVRVTLESSVE